MFVNEIELTGSSPFIEVVCAAVDSKPTIQKEDMVIWVTKPATCSWPGLALFGTGCESSPAAAVCSKKAWNVAKQTVNYTIFTYDLSTAEASTLITQSPTVMVLASPPSLDKTTKWYQAIGLGCTDQLCGTAGKTLCGPSRKVDYVPMGLAAIQGTGSIGLFDNDWAHYLQQLSWQNYPVSSKGLPNTGERLGFLARFDEIQGASGLPTQ